MFKISIMVNDSKLPAAMKALDGLGYNLEVQLVKNAEPASSSPKERRVREAGDKTGPEAVIAVVKVAMATGAVDATDPTIQSTTILRQAKEFGLAASAIQYGITKSVKDGILVRREQRGLFGIDREKLATV